MEEKEVNIKRLFIALYRAIECLNDEQRDANMENFLSDADPYIFTDRAAAEPALQNEFEEKISLYNADYFDYENLYNCVFDYLKEATAFSERFTEISKDEWRELCRIIDRECNDENVWM